MKVDFSKTLIMGILNVTPDSFSDGGDFINPQAAIAQAKKIILDGADILDIGGESTRPGAQKISVQEELKRVLPIIKAIRTEFPTIEISIDTYKSEVAEQAVLSGATIINDVSGLQLSNNTPAVAAKLQAPIIINHMKGTPQTMQKEIFYKDVIEEITQFFTEKIKLLEENGVKRENIILDPGFGFGKTVEHNITILNNLHTFKKFNLPILIGVSRKSSLGKLLQENFGHEFVPKDRLFASLAATAVAIEHGANIVRCHDVLETKQFVTILDTMRSQRQ